MRLTLLRHAEAADRKTWNGEDADRPLTRDGIARATYVLKRTRDLLRAEEIWTSPWLRARATAELASGICKLPLTEVPWLASGAATPKERAAHLRDALDLILVGHEPDLSELAAHLTGGAGLSLSKAGLAILKGEPLAGKMTVHALVNPKTLAAITGDSI